MHPHVPPYATLPSEHPRVSSSLRRLLVTHAHATLAAALAFICCTATSALASNPYFNQPVCTAVGTQSGAQMVPDGTGGAIVVWSDSRPGGGLFAQRVNAAGVSQWTVNGVPVDTSPSIGGPEVGIAPDGAGGVIVMWTSGTTSPLRDIRAQRLDATGTQQWAAGGVAVCTASGDQFAPSIVPDGLGGAIAFWRDFRSGVDTDVYTQRVDASGTPQWTTDGVPVCTAAGDQFNPLAVEDAANGAIATWLDNRGANTNVYAQRVDATGTAQWTANGVALGSPTGIQNFPAPISDGAGGAIVAWQTGFNIFSPGSDDIYVQHVDASGTPQWTTNGVALCTATNVQSIPMLASDGAGGAIAAWRDYRTGNNGDIYAQRVDAAGAPQWTTNGAAICAGVSNVVTATIGPDGTGGAILAWQENRPAIGGFANLFAQRVNGAGTPQWTTNGSAVSIAAGVQGNPRLLADGSGGALVVWTDDRDISQDIYDQQVDASGNPINGPAETYGSITGQILTDCPSSGTPLRGVTVDAFSAGNGDLLGTGTTDASGNYTIPSIFAIHYTVSVVTPLGYNTVSDISLKVNAGQTAFQSFFPTCTTSTGNPSSANYWKHQIGIATGGNGNAKIDGPTICSYLDLIELHFNNNALNQVVVYAPPTGSTCAQKLEIVKALLNFGNSAAPVDKARQQLTALMLNVAANFLDLNDVISKDGATVSQAITYCDQLIDNPTGDRTLAAAIADKINGGQSVAAGQIPLTTAQIAYARGMASRTFRVLENPGPGARAFQFAMGEPGVVRLRVFDIAGRQVADLVNRTMEAGVHVVSWDARARDGQLVENGVYFARLETEGGMKTVKMVQLTK